VAKGVDAQIDVLMQRLDKLEELVARIAKVLSIELTKTP